MKKLYLLVLAFALSLGVMQAQQLNARKILDNTAKRLNGKSLQAQFKATLFQKGKSGESTSGKIYLKGKKMHVQTPQMLMWFDGTTQWQYLKANNEVNVSHPTEAEIQEMNPYRFINLYKKGYAYSATKTTLRGTSCYEVTLRAQNRNTEIPEMKLSIDTQNYALLCVRLKQRNGNWTRLSLYNLKTGGKMSDDQFRFNHNDYPNTEVIDLR